MNMEITVLDRLLAIASLFRSDMARSFAGTSLTETRVHALWVLADRGPSTQQDLSSALSVTPRSVSALVDSLVATGYAERRSHPNDRRAVLVELTAHASEMMRRMQDDHRRLSAALLGAVHEPDRPAFERGLDAVLGKLDELVRTESVRYTDVEPGGDRAGSP